MSINVQSAIAEIRALENRRQEAMVKGDLDELAQMLDDDLVYTHSSGVRENKAEYLKLLGTGRVKYQKIDRPEENIRIEGHVAIVTGRLEVDAIVEGHARHLSGMWVGVWVKRAENWRMAAWQSTRITGH